MSYVINKVDLKFEEMNVRRSTRRLVLHHAAAKICSVEDVHRWHFENGWSGIGYHFFVRKDGTIWQGRPIEMVGAHAYGYNSDSIGICFEGNFENEAMPKAQKDAGKWLVSYVLGLYPTITTIQRHKDLMATACPGRNFPFTEIKKGVSATNKTTTTTKGDSKVNVQLDVLKVGSTGAQVKALQRMLYAMGYKLGNNPIDGDFGAKTEDAVCSYQKKNGLVEDGIVGQNTWTKLLGA